MENTLQPKDLKDMTLQEMMEHEVAETCLNDNPKLFKNKWIAAYGNESWENSVYAIITQGKV